jgi:hypothetical protein
MIDFLIFLCGAAVGMLASVAIISCGKMDRIQEAYEEGKADGFQEGYYAGSYAREKKK